MHSQRGRPKFARQTEATLQTLDIREFSLRRILLMRDRRSLSPLLPWAALNLLGSSMGCHAERESARSCSCRRRLHEAVVCYSPTTPCKRINWDRRSACAMRGVHVVRYSLGLRPMMSLLGPGEGDRGRVPEGRSESAWCVRGVGGGAMRRRARPRRRSLLPN